MKEDQRKADEKRKRNSCFISQATRVALHLKGIQRRLLPDMDKLHSQPINNETHWRIPRPPADKILPLICLVQP